MLYIYDILMILCYVALCVCVLSIIISVVVLIIGLLQNMKR